MHLDRAARGLDLLARRRADARATCTRQRCAAASPSPRQLDAPRAVRDQPARARAPPGRPSLPAPKARERADVHDRVRSRGSGCGSRASAARRCERHLAALEAGRRVAAGASACPAPCVPRPDVLPLPEPGPRPTRLCGASSRAPDAGLRVDRASASSTSTRWRPCAIMPRTAGVSLSCTALAEPAEAEAAQRRALAAGRRRSGSSPSVTLTISVAHPLQLSPASSPRSAASRCSGSRSCGSASIVALTTLCGLFVPRTW